MSEQLKWNEWRRSWEHWIQSTTRERGLSGGLRVKVWTRIRRNLPCFLQEPSCRLDSTLCNVWKNKSQHSWMPSWHQQMHVVWKSWTPHHCMPPTTKSCRQGRSKTLGSALPATPTFKAYNCRKGICHEQKGSYYLWYGGHWNSLFKFKAIFCIIWFGSHSLIYIRLIYYAIESWEQEDGNQLQN